MENGLGDPQNAVADLDLEETLAELVSWYEGFEEATQEARKQSERDRDYYDGIQWDSAEINELNDRGQPVTTINRIAPKINYIIGAETNTRTDPKAYPRTPAEDDCSEAITDALRYISDKEKIDRIKSDVFENQIVEGYGGVVVGFENTPDGQDPKLTHIPWDRVWYDPHSRHPLFLDAKYLGVVRWADHQDAVEDPQYKKALDILDSVGSNTSYGSETHDDKPQGWYDPKRNRLKIVECYWKHKGVWIVAHYVKSGFLIRPTVYPLFDDKGKSVCPIKLVSGLITRKENKRYGLVRNLVSPQEVANKCLSKYMHAINSDRVVAEEGAVLNPQEAQTERAKPDGWVTVQPGALTGGSIMFDKSQELSMGQLQLLQELKAAIDTTGPDAALVASDKRAMSGRAFLARQQAGQMELGRVFDHIREWEHSVFEAIWFAVRLSWTNEKWLRVRDDEERSGFRFVGINQNMTRAQRLQQLLQDGVPLDSATGMLGLAPFEVSAIIQQAQQVAQQQVMQQMQGVIQQAQQSGQQMPPEMAQQLEAQAQQQIQALTMQLALQSPPMQEPIVVNSIGQLDVDIIIDSAPESTILQHEQFESMVSLAQSGMVPIPPEVLIKMSDLRDKRELIEMLSKPDAQAQQAQQAQMQQLQAQMQALQAEIQKTQAETAKIAAEAQAVQYSAEKDQAQAMKYAAEAGEKTLPDTAVNAGGLEGPNPNIPQGG